MKLTDTLLTISYICLLLFSFVMLFKFYTCDNHTCKAFIDAENSATVGTKKYYIELLNNIFNDGVWCFPFVGASISTLLCFWFLNIPITLNNFGLLFFVTFCVVYFSFAYFGYHYVKVITEFIGLYMKDNCTDEFFTPASNISYDDDNDIPVNNIPVNNIPPDIDNKIDTENTYKKQIPNYYQQITINPNY